MDFAQSSIPHRIRVSDDDSYMLIGEVCERFHCSKMWVRRHMADPHHPFPKPIKFGGATSARRWRRADVLTWEAVYIKLSERN